MKMEKTTEVRVVGKYVMFASCIVLVLLIPFFFSYYPNFLWDLDIYVSLCKELAYVQ